MKILVLGGTQFVGRQIVETALERGHELTLFHRGQTNRHLFGERVESRHGDRKDGLDPLGSGEWDVAIDVCGYVPRVVTTSARFLADRVERYIFISTLSVYAESETPGQDEDAPLAGLADPSVEVVNGETYGGLKVLCEKAVEASMPARSLVIRPGLIVGPHDHTDRFTYWPVRAATADRVLAPPVDTRVEFTDVRDLAGWTVRCAEERRTGIFNASGPAPDRPTFGEFLDVCTEAAGCPSSPFVPVDAGFLRAQKISAWSDLPLWIGPDSPGFATRSCRRAIEAGLTFRPVIDTVRDTLEWARSREAGLTLKAGLDPEREREALDAWERRPETRPG